MVLKLLEKLTTKPYMVRSENILAIKICYKNLLISTQYKLKKNHSHSIKIPILDLLYKLCKLRDSYKYSGCPLIA